MNIPQVIAYLGPLNSGAAKVNISPANKGGLLQISYANTWPGSIRISFSLGKPGIFCPTGRQNYFRTTLQTNKAISPGIACH
jgi:branched-chain amino acid transport system substrate-binding protein